MSDALVEIRKVELEMKSEQDLRDLEEKFRLEKLEEALKLVKSSPDGLQLENAKYDTNQTLKWLNLWKTTGGEMIR